jgi:hypothetical protein
VAYWSEIGFICSGIKLCTAMKFPLGIVNLRSISGYNKHKGVPSGRCVKGPVAFDILQYKPGASVFDIGTDYGLDDRGVGVRVSEEARILYSPGRPYRLLRPTQFSIQWVPGAFSPGIKRPGREVDHSPPTSAEVKKMCFYTSSPPYVFMT